VESEAASSRGRRRHVDDELGHLIGIYGSKELLINEYRNMLAERLLTKVVNLHSPEPLTLNPEP
jgi:anaphase-promoting complex subunit 2